ncbi:AI-2E family transporter [Erythrobacteraceae bacterium CFH 75059]|uniref:AI-2E family transporter n=1 Tax=Qipengyuania thermophila TaxID=2509361 RepID=UPI00101FE795|nr:AI-2E family transporter [Qipengyuania thermophila]TCD06502.1 AI-2E family transporter [Erythrobacteraceae bacterium CFH 75059]
MLHTRDRDATERGAFLVLLAIVTLALITVVRPFASALLFAALAAVMFQPLYNRILLRRPDQRNGAAVATLLIITFAVVIPLMIIGSIVLRQATQIVLAFRDGRIDPAAWLVQLRESLPAGIRTQMAQAGWDNVENLQTQAQEFLSESAGVLATYALSIGGSALGFVLSFAVGLYVLYFLLRDGRRIGRAVIAALPLERDIADLLAERFLSIVRATIKGTVIVGMVQGALGAITFWLVGLPSAVLFGVLMAIMSLVPAVGPAIVWLPAAIWLLASGDWWQGLVVIGSGVGVIGLADNLLRPVLVGRDTGIPDWIVLVTTLGGIATMGLSGIVVGPLIAGLFLACWSILQEQRENALADDLPAPSPEVRDVAVGPQPAVGPRG